MSMDNVIDLLKTRRDEAPPVGNGLSQMILLHLLSKLPVVNSREDLDSIPLGTRVNYGGYPGTVIQRPVRTSFPGIPQSLIDMYLKDQKKAGLIKTVQYQPLEDNDQ